MRLRPCFERLLLCVPLLGAAVHARGVQQQRFGQLPAQHRELARRAAFTADVEKREAIKTAFLDNYANYESACSELPSRRIC